MEKSCITDRTIFKIPDEAAEGVEGAASNGKETAPPPAWEMSEPPTCLCCWIPWQAANCALSFGLASTIWLGLVRVIEKDSDVSRGPFSSSSRAEEASALTEHWILHTGLWWNLKETLYRTLSASNLHSNPLLLAFSQHKNFYSSGIPKMTFNSRGPRDSLSAKCQVEGRNLEVWGWGLRSSCQWGATLRARCSGGEFWLKLQSPVVASHSVS